MKFSIVTFLCFLSFKFSDSQNGDLEKRITTTIEELKKEVEGHGDISKKLNEMIEEIGIFGKNQENGKKIKDLAIKLSTAQIDLDEQRQTAFYHFRDLLKDVQEHGAQNANKEEQKLYDLALEKQADSKFDEALNLLNQSWAQYNRSESEHLEHSIELIFIFEWMEYVLFKLDRISEALWICRLGLEIEGLNDFHRQRFEVSVDFYEGLLKKNETANLTPSQMAKQLADSATYESCQPGLTSP